jgi:carbamoyl-phosphate synthase large subunit
MISVLITSIGCAPASAIARILAREKKYNIIGIDIQKECVGTFISNVYLRCPGVISPDYEEFIRNVILVHKVECVFVTHPNDTVLWSKLKETLDCRVFVNDATIVDITDDKQKTYEWCIINDIAVPNIVDIDYRPCVIKPLRGCGSNGIVFLKDNAPSPDISSEYIIQRFITGDEYTVDVISDENSNIVNIVPKKRLLIKNGQSFKSITCMDDDIIEFVRNVVLKLKSKYVINVQVIKETDTNNIFLIEINPRWATTISLSVEAEVNMPVMLIENDYTPKQVRNNLLMIRDYHEYFCERH